MTSLMDAFAQADLGLHCPLTESVDTVVYVDKQNVQIRLHRYAGLAGPLLLAYGVRAFFSSSASNIFV